MAYNAINANDFTWLGFTPAQIIDNIYETLSNQGYRVHVLDLTRFIMCTPEGNYNGHDYDGISREILRIQSIFRKGDILILREDRKALAYRTYTSQQDGTIKDELIEVNFANRRLLNNLRSEATYNGLLININGS
ncbi:MAG TPA: hypothetical protein PK957_00465 [Candidatus Dojkabacteria bacterium]|nr:hypothetical protein [Candidatus Dojkabacteria bacterium]HQF36086.1 hypothetical protein [Candidatus Dojkabacteria bacterium]